jgi:phosphoglucosamine mutase
MSRKYFGTDGIRGRANVFPMTAEIALKVAMATAVVLRQSQSLNQSRTNTDRVVIGKDTRLSCYMLEQAMAAGFGAMGMDVILTGPIPTPGVAMLTRSLRADVGVMISASHNPYQDNGIKLFGADGYKLDDVLELEIERATESDLSAHAAPADEVGKASRLDDALGRYVEFIKQSFPKGQTLDGLKVALDCAHGAAYKAAPQIFWELEADLVAIGVQPNGRNINDAHGATATENLQKTVLLEKADIGIALDGDADRLIVIDETGQKIDGDQLMASLALSMKQAGTLKGGKVAATVMSNLGFERFLFKNGIGLLRTSIGDRYVVEAMRQHDLNLGGEQSGHIVLSDFGTTGDGLLAALQILANLKASGLKASEALKLFEPMPQILQNVVFDKGRGNAAAVLDVAAVQDAIAEAEGRLGGTGRILVRPSGTEPVIRVMAEGDNPSQVEKIVNDVCSVIDRAAQSA